MSPPLTARQRHGDGAEQCVRMRGDAHRRASLRIRVHRSASPCFAPHPSICIALHPYASLYIHLHRSASLLCRTRIAVRRSASASACVAPHPHASRRASLLHRRVVAVTATMRNDAYVPRLYPIQCIGHKRGTAPSGPIRRPVRVVFSESFSPSRLLRVISEMCPDMFRAQHPPGRFRRAPSRGRPNQNRSHSGPEPSLRSRPGTTLRARLGRSPDGSAGGGQVLPSQRSLFRVTPQHPEPGRGGSAVGGGFRVPPAAAAASRIPAVTSE